VIATDGTVLVVEESTGTDGYRLTVKARLATEDDSQLTTVFIASGQPRLAIQRIYETWFAGNTQAMARKLDLVRRFGHTFLRMPGGSLRPKKAT
jgi:hypothetical protein